MLTFTILDHVFDLYIKKYTYKFQVEVLGESSGVMLKIILTYLA